MAKYRTTSYGNFKIALRQVLGSHRKLIYANNYPPENEIKFQVWAQSYGSPHIVIFRSTQGMPDSFVNDFRDDSVEGVLEHPTLFEVE